MTHRFALMAAYLAGLPAPPLPDLLGRVIRAADQPLTDEDLAGVTSPTELGLILGITRQAAAQRLRKTTTTEGPTT